MADTYKSFGELIKYEKEGADFDIEINDRGSHYAIIAIHGGNIEPATTELARILADKSFSFYSFIGNNTEKECEKLHITSSHFDEPRCYNLVHKSSKTISIHGKSGGRDFIMVGGLDNNLIQRIIDVLRINGFKTERLSDDMNGNSPLNICNKCSSKKGVQFEISRGLRDKFLNDSEELSRFCDIIRSVLIL
jgi:phage replication-related protein YjqB (UPF0714/DUF867 family)